MEKEFVTYEIALALKELGFDEECLMLWEHTDFWTNLIRPEEFKKIVSERYCNAPLWQQVIDYFREEHNIIIDVAEIYKGLGNYHFALNLEWEYFEGTYYEAREAAILKAIEIIKKK